MHVASAGCGVGQSNDTEIITKKTNGLRGPIPTRPEILWQGLGNLRDIWEKEAIGPRSKISQKRPKSGLFDPERLRGHYVVTTRSLHGHYAVTTRSLRGHYAVTTVTTRSLRSHYAVTTRSLRSLRGHHADTTRSKRATRSRLRNRSTSLQNGLFDQDIVAVDLEGSDFINASNLIHYTANRFQV